MKFKNPILLSIKRVIEAFIVLVIYFILAILPINLSSFLIGKLLSVFGRFHKAHKYMQKNLQACFPEKNLYEINKIAISAWENLGRTAAELPKITFINNEKIKEISPISGLENVLEAKKYSQEKGKNSIIFVSAHIGNWELATRTVSLLEPSTGYIYRKANNPFVEKIITKTRSRYTNYTVAKGDISGMKELIKHLKNGDSLGILIDQKISDGHEVDFFSMKVTASATVADLALKLNCPIVMGRNIRDETTKTNFVLKFETPIYPENITSEEITQKIYRVYESWIREYPNQWLWQHKRFPIKYKE
jgi:KDO2-lipid IV(A) lauroyltransferase